MFTIDHSEITNWGKTFESKGYFPKLVGKLILETTPKSTRLNIPSGSAVYFAGWDGIVRCEESTNFVPEGISLWELGANGDKSKASSDYSKRTKDSLDFDKSESTFIFVTTTYWGEEEKKNWIEKRLADGIWKDIIVYDSTDLALWLEDSPISFLWFSKETRRYPSNGVYPFEEYWYMLSFGPNGLLSPSIVTSGRDIEKDQLLDFFKNPPSLLAVRGPSIHESISFILACILEYDDQVKELINSRGLVVESSESFHSLRINRNELNFIAKVIDHTTLYSGVGDGHHILLPLGPDDNFRSNDIINLPRIDGAGLVSGLTKMGLTDSEAKQYSKESGKDYTILKALLGYPGISKNWNSKLNTSELIPAFLIGRWNESFDGDKELISILASESYEDYKNKLTKWLDVESPPLIKIGDTWRVTSPLDLWSLLYSRISKEDLKSLEECVIKALTFLNDDQKDLNHELFQKIFQSIPEYYSGWSKQGLIQSLILIALYGNDIGLGDTANQKWVDSIISSILSNADGVLWSSLDQYLPLIAEASPNEFLNSIRKSLRNHKPEVMEMFIESPTAFSTESNHTGLLWGLENLSWDPEYFKDSTFILAHLAAIDPGGRISPRPINSLKEIFKPWHYQTFADTELILDTLSLLINKYYEVGWEISLSMIPSGNDVAHPTHRMRWRYFSQSYDRKITYKEIFKSHEYVINLLLANYDKSESKFSDLIDISLSNQIKIPLTLQIRSFLKHNVSSIAFVNHSVWAQLRNILYRHRSYPDVEWSLPEDVLRTYEELYTLLEPEDALEKIVWLFEEYYARLPEGFNHKVLSNEQWNEIVFKKRVDTLKGSFAKFGLDFIIELSSRLEDKSILGTILPEIINQYEEIFPFLELTNEDESTLSLVQAFVAEKFTSLGKDWLNDFIKSASKDFEEKHIAMFLLQVGKNMTNWLMINDFGEIISEVYWGNMYPNFYRLSIEDITYGINKLIESGRSKNILRLTSANKKDLSTDILTQVLESIEDLTEKTSTDVYDIQEIFQELDLRDDLEASKQIKLELQFLPILTDYGSHFQPKSLHNKLSNEPEFFIDLIKLVYKSEDDNELAEVDPKVSKNAHSLLKTWNQIPGIDSENNIDLDFLNKWVQEARSLAEKEKRLPIADVLIGQQLANYPELSEPWPPHEICSIIDEINSDSLKSGFSTGTFNKRGSSVRSPFDGGTIEKQHAEYFLKQSKLLRGDFPTTANILKELSDNYLISARRMDERAERTKLDYQ